MVFVDTKPLRIDIQVLRAFSVIVVVAYHLSLPGFENGFLGVDIFFVISGYLMAQLYTRSNAFDFYKRRAKRLLPAYWATIVASIVVATLVSVSSDFSQVLEQAKASFALIPNVYFWSQDSYFSSRNFNPLLNLWSLGVEIQFYLFVPLISWFAKKRYILMGLSFFTLAACFSVLAISPKTAFFITPFRFWEFLVGYLFFELAKNNFYGRSKNFRYAYFFPFGLVFIIFLYPIDALSTSPLIGHPGLSSILVTITTGLVLISGIQVSVNALTKILNSIGTLSYSIYLVHFPLLAFYFYEPFQGNSFGRLNALMLFLFLFTLIVLSAALNKFVENKFRQVSFNPTLVLACLVAISLIFPTANELKQRSYSTKEANISRAYFDRATYRCGKKNRIINPTALLCRISPNESEKKVLLLGNSHADSIKMSFAEMATESGITTYFWVQNDPLNGGRQSAQEIADEVAKNRIKTVFLHYSSGAVKREVLIDFISRMYLNGINVSILGPIPTWPESVPEVMWLDKEKTLLSQSHAEFKTSNHVPLRTLTDIARDFDLNFFDLSQEFCREECKYADSTGVPYYWDEGHLTLTGAQVLRPLFRKVISSEFNTG